MFKSTMLAVGVAACFTAAPAQAQSGGYQPDPQVVGALNEMIYTAGLMCQSGDQQACWSMNYLQQFGNQMMQAGAACQAGNNEGCYFYQQAYGELSQGYQMMQQQMAMAQSMQVPQGYGTTHQQRMQAIQDFGAANTAAWQQRQQLNDQSHQRFIESIRE